MSQQINPNPNPNEEVDIIALFEYFRKGFWNFIDFIIKILKFFFNLFVRLFILLKKNILIVAGIIILFGVLGYLYNLKKSEEYYYEMILKANYNSVYELYNYIESLSKDLDKGVSAEVLAQKTGLQVDKAEGLKEIGIEPVEDFEDVLSSYYGAKGSPFTPSVRDSIFYQTYTIEDYKEKVLQPKDYSLQKVFIVADRVMAPRNFEQALIDTINKFSIFDSQKKARLEALTSKENNLKAQKSLIDSLLVNLSSEKSTIGESSSLSLRGESKSNVEDDLLNQSRAINDELFSIILQKEKESIILQPVSSIRLVERKEVFKLNAITGVIIGFITSLLVLLAIEANRGLMKYAAREFSN